MLDNKFKELEQRVEAHMSGELDASHYLLNFVQTVGQLAGCTIIDDSSALEECVGEVAVDLIRYCKSAEIDLIEAISKELTMLDHYQLHFSELDELSQVEPVDLD